MVELKISEKKEATLFKGVCTKDY